MKEQKIYTPKVRLEHPTETGMFIIFSNTPQHKAFHVSDGRKGKSKNRRPLNIEEMKFFFGKLRDLRKQTKEQRKQRTVESNVNFIASIDEAANLLSSLATSDVSSSEQQQQETFSTDEQPAVIAGRIQRGTNKKSNKKPVVNV